MSFPKPPGLVEKKGELEVDESSFILDSTLSDKNRNDKTVIQFIESFVRCKSIPQASADCGIHRTLGYAIRNKKDVANCIQKLIDKSVVKHGFDNSELVERVKEFVDFDPIQVQNPDGSFKSNMHDISPEARRSIKKLKVKNLWNQVEDLNGIKSKIIIGEVIEYEFYDKIKASELVGKEKEMFKNTTKVEHGVTKDMAAILLASTQRAELRIVDQTKEVVEVTEYKNVENDEEIN